MSAVRFFLPFVPALLLACGDKEASNDRYEEGVEAGRQAAEAEFADRLSLVEAQLAALESSDPSAMVADHDARLAEIEGAYLTAADLDGLATESWVVSQDYGSTAAVGANSDAIAGLLATVATTDDLSDFLTAADLSGYATEGWVSSQAYLTSSALSGYATQSWVSAQGYSTTPGVEDLDSYVTVDTATDTITFTSANVHIRNGQGTSSPSSPNGLGNLIIGYDEDDGDTKTGSHNIVVGPYHTYTTASGLLVGYDNELSVDAYWSSALGLINTVTGQGSTITGGRDNEASGSVATVHGGYANVASGFGAGVAGGELNESSDNYTVVVGGYDNTAGTGHGVLLGGSSNATSGGYSIAP